MDNKEFSERLEKRTLDFALRILKLSASLPSSPEGFVLRNQITKAGTSIGANYREANCASSRADFKNKIKICQGEASEACYWLELIVASGNFPENKMGDIMKECKELLALFTSIRKGT